MVWVKITTLLRLGDFHRRGYNNKHVVTVRKQSQSRLKESKVDCRKPERNSCLLCLSPMNC